MSKVLISEASQLSGKSVATLNRYCKSGKLSFTTNTDGYKVIDIAELERVCGKLNDAQDNTRRESMRINENHAEHLPAIPDTPEVVEVLREQVRLLQSQICVKDAQIEAAHKEKDRLLNIADKLALPKPSEETPKKSWWQGWGFLRNPSMIL